MVKELNDLIEILNKHVRFFYEGLETEGELKTNTDEILRFYFTNLSADNSLVKTIINKK